MTLEDMKLLTEIIDDLKEIKIYGVKAEAYNKGLRDDGLVVDIAQKRRIKIPTPEKFFGSRRSPKNLEELHDLVKGYIGTINREDKEILDEMDYEFALANIHRKAFHNEVPPYYNASFFFDYFYDVLRAYTPKKCRYYVEIHDIPEITIGFPNRATAKKFIDVYTGPCILFEEKDLCWEVVGRY